MFIYKIIRVKVDKFTFIYSHGNSSDLGGCMAFAIMISYYFTVNVIVYDYVGYGIAPG